MRKLPVFFALVFCFSACLSARADDYQIGVQDPPMPQQPGQFYQLTQPGVIDPLSFGSCAGLPIGGSYDGCFAVVNETGAELTGLTFTIPDEGGIGSQTASCDYTSSTAIFSGGSCPPTTISNNDFVLTFTDGEIPATGAGTFFVITETGVPYLDFPEDGTATATEAAAVTPEPSSLLLLATGMCLGGVLITRRRLFA